MRGHCAMCGAHLNGAWGADVLGHNPEPLGDFDARVCDACNASFVIPARLGAFTPAQIMALRSLTSSWAEPTP